MHREIVRPRGVRIALATALVLMALQTSRAQALDRQVVQNFDDQEEGIPPAGWIVGDQSGPLGNWMVQSGELAIEGGGTGTGGGGKEVWIWYDRTFAGDITIEFNIKWLSSPAPDVGRHGGVSFFSKFPGAPGSRYAGMNGYTMDWIDRPSDHGIRLHKWTNGAETGLLQDGLFTEPEPPELWRLEIRGDTISIYLDDALFQEVQDITYRDGYIGFYQWENNLNVHYDNLTVTNPDLVVNRDFPDALVNGTSGTAKLTVLPYLAGTVVVKEDLPVGLTPSSASGGGVVNGQKVEWNLGNISDTVELTYAVAASLTAVDVDLGGTATHNGVPYPIAGDTQYTGSPQTTLGFVKLWNHLGPLAFQFPAVAGDDGPPGACDANGGVDLTLDWIVNESGSVTEADVTPFPGMVTRPAYGGDGQPGGTGARAAGLTLEAGGTGLVVQDRSPVWKGSLTRSDTIDHATASVHGFDADDHLTMSCVYVTNNTGAQIDTQLGFASDDSVQIFLNDVDLTAGGIVLCRGYGAANEEQNTVPVSLPTGESRLLVKVTDGAGGSGFRLRFQDPADPFAPGILAPDLTFSLESAKSPRQATATRSFTQASYDLGGTADVALAVSAQPAATSLTLTEVLPESATAEAISDGGVLSGGAISWSLSNVSAKTVTYKLRPALCGSSSTYGQSTWTIGTTEALVSGPSTLPRSALAPDELASWENSDIGAAGGAAKSLSEHDVVIDAGGAGIKLKEDQFHFVYVPMKGDVEMTVKIDCMSDSSIGGQVGIMLRDTLDVFSAHASLVLATGDLAKTGLRTLRGLLRRETNPARIGSAITIVDKDVPSLPIWLRVRRAGGKVSFFRSSNGTDFGLPIAEKDIGTTTTQVNLRDDVLVGIAATGAGGKVSATVRDVTGPSFTASAAEICGNSIDDDSDTFVDCLDSDCAGDPACPVGTPMHRGDADDNGVLQLTDAIRILGFLFLGGTPPTCLDAGDADDNGVLQLTDAIRVLGFLFLGGAPPAPPGPPSDPCGVDAGGELGCASYTKC